MSLFKPNVFDGVVGMIRFGTNRSPELYYALGDLLAADGKKALAYRAYQRALDSGHPRPGAVKMAMQQVREMVVPQAEFDPALISAERAAADKWVTEYQQFEDHLIRAGKDTDDEANYAPFYVGHPRALATSDFFWSDLWRIHRYEVLTVAVCPGVPLVGTALGVRWSIRRRRRNRPAGGYDRPPE